MEPPNSTEESLEDFRRQWQEEISLSINYLVPILHSSWISCTFFKPEKINQESAESLGAFSPSDSQCESIDSRTVEDKVCIYHIEQLLE